MKELKKIIFKNLDFKRYYYMLPRHWLENKTLHLKRYDSKIVVYLSKRTSRKMR